MGYQGQLSRQDLQELTLELANVLSGACINGISNELKINLHFDAPTLLEGTSNLLDFFQNRNASWIDALFLDVEYKVNSIAMHNHLIFCMVEKDSHEFYKLIGKRINNK